MEITMAVLVLLAGVGVFIAGMNMLGDGLEKSAGWYFINTSRNTTLPTSPKPASPG